MTAWIVAIDFAGTLVKASAIERAAMLRSETLDLKLPTAAQHGDPERLYEDNRDALERICGVKDNMTVLQREADGDDVSLSGVQFKNVLSTTIFGIGLLKVVNEDGKDIFAEGMLEEIGRIRGLGYEIAIVSGVRRDLISAALEITGTSDLFDYIEGQPPTLGLTNEQLLEDLSDYGEIKYVIGDKLTDLDPAHHVGAKAVFATWGHPSGGEEALADHTIDTPADLRDVISD